MVLLWCYYGVINLLLLINTSPLYIMQQAKGVDWLHLVKTFLPQYIILKYTINYAIMTLCYYDGISLL